MLASTHFDPVIGVDIHIVLVPAPPAPPIPTPVPMPFMGMVFDPVGLVVGAAVSTALSGSPGLVSVNLLPATNGGTSVLQTITVPHLPAPGVAFARGLPGNDAELFMGSLDVSFAGTLCVRLGELALSCSDPVRLPTSAVLALPKGRPVLVMRAPVPDVTAMAMAAAFRAIGRALAPLIRAGRRLFRFIRRAARACARGAAGRALLALERALARMRPNRLRSRVPNGRCHSTGHPVDVATGRMFTEAVDFELPGPLPLRFERRYDSSLSWRDGALGPGWSHTLDQALWRERGKVVLRSDDGRELEFHTYHLPDRTIVPGQEVFLETDRLTLRCLDEERWEVEDHLGVRRTFAPVGPDRTTKLIEIRSRAGHRIELHHDDAGHLEWARDACGRLVRFTHDGLGRLTEIKLPLMHERGWSVYRRFHYDAAGDLVAVEDATGARWRFEYVRHLMVRETDRAGLSFYFQYDGLGSGARCIRTWGDGGIYDHVIDYDVANRRTIVEDSVGGRTVYEMDALGHVIAVTDPAGATARYAHDGDSGQVTLEVDPLGAQTRRAYDEHGNLTRLEGPDGAVVEIGWDAHASPVRVRDPLGHEHHYAYDEDGQLVAHWRPDGAHTHYEWRDGLLRRVTDGAGSVTALEYDAHKQLTRLTLPNEAALTYRYDGRGQLVRADDPRGGRARMRYDAEGRLVEHVGPLGLPRKYAYDAEGNLLESRDATRHVALGYAHFHRVAWREEAGERLAFEYDTEDRLVAVVNEHGERYRFELDKAGRVEAEVGFDGARTVYVRDVAGRVTLRVLPSARTSTLCYDAAGRPLAVEHDDGTYARFTYDARGDLLEARSERAHVVYERDALGRVVRESQDGGAHSVAVRYGASGARAEVETSLGARQRIERDALAEVASLRHGPGLERGFELAFERDVLGAERARAMPGGLRLEWERDVAGRPTARRTTRRDAGAVGPSPLPRELDVLVYQWRGEDQIGALIDPNRGARFFDHDRRGRLIRERRNGATLERAMDPAGNVYRRADRADRRYGPGGVLLEAEAPGGEGTVRYTHDADGNQTERLEPDGTRWRYRYDGHGLLRHVERVPPRAADAGPLPPPDLRLSFAYDAFARRVEKTVVALGPDGEEQSRRETRFVWDGHVVAHELDSQDGLTTWYWEPDTFTPVAKERAGRYYSIASDHLGTPTEMYDELGQLAWRMQLDAFGVPTFEAGDARDCPWRWPGQYEDVETGEYYNRWRWYDARGGRYSSKDPLGLRGSLRSFHYPTDSLLRVDPSGLVAQHHPIPSQLVSEMVERRMVADPGRDFSDTSRGGLAPLSDARGAHTHSQTHGALSDMLDPDRALGLRRGTQHGTDWRRYLTSVGDDPARVAADLDRFYNQWLPDQVASGRYPLISEGDVAVLRSSYESERRRVFGSGC
ncbi:MAG: RHS domain-containing protein [Sandaracinaceae bacterium]|nr:RHS domain-containing protein [Sandaracinaceae bacterium]